MSERPSLVLVLAVGAAAGALARPAAAQEPRDARAIVAEAQRRARSESQRYEGTLTVVDARGKTTVKRWRYDRIGSHGRSKAVLRFTEPPEVKGVALLIWNHPDKASDQWMWTPALGRDRRIAFQDRSTRFFGTDFSFEDLEERDVDQYDYALLGEEEVDGVACWKVESKPKETKSSQYTSALLWVRKSDWVWAKIESFKGKEMVRRCLYSRIEEVQRGRDAAHPVGIWTARVLDMTELARGSRTRLELEKLEYDVPMKDEDFTLQALRRE